MAIHQEDTILGTVAEMEVLTLEESEKKEANQGLTVQVTLGIWPNGIVPFEVTDGVDLDRLRFAMSVWHTNTNIRFIPRTNETDYLSVRPGHFFSCTSTHGYNKGGGAHIEMDPKSWTRL